VFLSPACCPFSLIHPPPKEHPSLGYTSQESMIFSAPTKVHSSGLPLPTPFRVRGWWRRPFPREEPQCILHRHIYDRFALISLSHLILFLHTMNLFFKTGPCCCNFKSSRLPSIQILCPSPQRNFRPPSVPRNGSFLCQLGLREKTRTSF